MVLCFVVMNICSRTFRFGTTKILTNCKKCFFFVLEIKKLKLENYLNYDKHFQDLERSEAIYLVLWLYFSISLSISRCVCAVHMSVLCMMSPKCVCSHVTRNNTYVIENVWPNKKATTEYNFQLKHLCVFKKIPGCSSNYNTQYHRKCYCYTFDMYVRVYECVCAFF